MDVMEQHKQTNTKITHTTTHTITKIYQTISKKILQQIIRISQTNPGIYQIIQHLPEIYRLLLHPNIFPIYHHFCWLKHVKSPKLWRNHVNSIVKNHVVLYPYYTNCIPNTPPILTKPLHPLPLPRLRPGLATSPLFPARRESAALGATTAP